MAAFPLLNRADERPDEWLEGANLVAGSWSPVWNQWVSEHASGFVAARKPGAGRLQPIEDAPGSYVRVRS